MGKKSLKEMSSDEEIQISVNECETKKRKQVNESVNECETKKRKQVDISSFFSGAAKQKRAETFTSSSKTSQPVTTSRTLQAATAEKWKTTRLTKYNAEQWLEQYVFAVLNVLLRCQSIAKNTHNAIKTFHVMERCYVH